MFRGGRGGGRGPTLHGMPLAKTYRVPAPALLTQLLQVVVEEVAVMEEDVVVAEVCQLTSPFHLPDCGIRPDGPLSTSTFVAAPLCTAVAQSLSHAFWAPCSILAVQTYSRAGLKLGCYFQPR